MARKKYTSSNQPLSDKGLVSTEPQDGSMKVTDFISQFEQGQVNVTDEVQYNLRDVIDENYRLYNSRFQESTDSTGLEKIFFNIGWILYRTVFFSSDIDQKDLQMRAQNPNAVPVVGLLRMAVENYLSRLHFGKTIDDIRAYMIAHGTAITKVAHGEPKLVELKNIVRPAHVENLQESGIAEKVFYTYEEMNVINLDEYAEYKVRDLWTKMQKEGQYLFPVYEYWHTFEINGKIHKGCKRYLDCTLLPPEGHDNNKSSWDPYVYLDSFKTPYKKRRTSRALIKKYGEWEEIFPYKQVNFIDCPGRWMGFGVFELIKGLQIYYNEKWHLYRKKDILDLRGIFKHKKGSSNASLEQRFMDAMETGAFVDLEQDEDIERLIMDMKTGEFVASVDKIMEMARQLIGVTSQGVGQEMPSTTTATVGVLNQKAQQTTYDYVIERMSHFLTELFEDFYMATILEEISEEEMFQIIGDPSELRELDKKLIDNLVNEQAHLFKAQYGFYPTAEVVDGWKEQMMSQQEGFGDMRFAELKADVIKALPFTVQFYVNNERFDKAVMIQNLTQMMQNPNFTGSREKLDEAILDLIGLSGRQFRKTKQEQEAELQQMAAMEQAKASAQQPINVPGPIGEGQQFGNASNPVSATS
jgi:hypothetical protein